MLLQQLYLIGIKNLIISDEPYSIFRKAQKDFVILYSDLRLSNQKTFTNILSITSKQMKKYLFAIATWIPYTKYNALHS